ncbi:hypothetical protein K505DRAFT_13476 [Melanomma pulvis-pyrius CBS 109.77]|uniref:Uncharacterized protein n=1 Tax=Melanomma pulvis-pyrius CBS 109.77 TaxID=1314802 RepID=A0A6A6XGW1_9PLEO|nr:hypothetical protein K505DRAFT_13476 [Melanomma pulvis-pyrius CBS 109.77]
MNSRLEPASKLPSRRRFWSSLPLDEEARRLLIPCCLNVTFKLDWSASCALSGCLLALVVARKIQDTPFPFGRLKQRFRADSVYGCSPALFLSSEHWTYPFRFEISLRGVFTTGNTRAVCSTRIP